MLPAQYIRAYVKRNKTDATDATDAAALLEAARCADIHPVRVKSVEQQALQGMHRRSNHNKAACALANKLARICYATLRDKAPFGEQTARLGKNLSRENFVMPA